MIQHPKRVKRVAYCLAGVVLFFCLSPSVQAQAAAPPMGNTAQAARPAYPLADALRTAKQPPGSVVLAAGAQSVTLPPAAVLGAGATVAETAAAFGQITQTFGAVAAVAPPTATVLNTKPAFSNLYDGLAPEEALKLLAVNLDDAQWQSLVSAQGLGLGDLSNEAQRALFLDLLPPEPFQVKSIAFDRDENAPPRAVTGGRADARLRLGQTVQFQLPSKGNADFRGIIVPTPILPGQPPQYSFKGNGVRWSPTLDGIPIRAEVPNVLKSGQLDYRQPALQVPVPVAGLRRVGDLVGRVGALAHFELYADRRYEGRLLTITGPALNAPAADLLRALALCLTGTWRRVGQAYVLTDDVQGAGTRRQILADFHKGVEAQRRTLLASAGTRLASAHGLSDLSGFGDPLALSPSEREQASHTPWAARYHSSLAIGVAFARMTAPQQEEARRITQVFEQANQENPNDVAFQSDLAGSIQLIARPVLQVLLPSLDGPVTLPLDLTELLEGIVPPVIPAPAAPAKQAAFALTPRRAVLAAPKTTKDVDALVAAMKPLGLNQLWLATSPPSDGPDLVAYALKATKGTGIGVFPTLDLLTWETPRAAADADLDLLDRTSVQDGGKARTAVSAFSPRVASDLAASVRAMSAEPGIAGLVWRETAPPGYALPAHSLLPDYDAPPDLGYTEPARLAFLRLTHTDPLDITDTDRLNLAETVDTRLPGFDGTGEDSALATQWRQFRSDADTALLRGLYNVAGTTSGAARPRIFIHQQRPGPSGVDWYGSWDDPKAPLPTARKAWDDLLPGQAPAPPQDALTQARRQSQLVYLSVPLGDAVAASEIAAHLPMPVPGKAWDGVVFDLTAAASGVEHLDTLKALVGVSAADGKK